MKQLVLVKRKNCYEARIYRTGDENDWKKVGSLRLDDRNRWYLRPAKGFELKKTYFKDLVKTYDAMEQDLLEILQK